MRNVILISALVAAILGQSIFFVAVLVRVSEYTRDYQVSRDDFYSAVDVAISNQLARFVDQPHSVAGDISVDPVVFYADLCTWCDFRGIYHAQYDGVRYSVGDWCDHGLVTMITDGRLYALKDGVHTIIRRKHVKEFNDGGRSRSSGPSPVE